MKGNSLAPVGGLVANLLTDVPGSSDYFLFSAVTYANQVKMKALNVNLQTLEKYGAVSEQTAREMARRQGGVVGFRLYAESDNEAAHATYKACGMDLCSYRMFEQTL